MQKTVKQTRGAGRYLCTLLGIAVLAVALPAGAADGPFGLSRSTKVMVLLDPLLPLADVTAKLAEAGFTTLERIPGLALPSARLVALGADPQAKAKLRAVPGVVGIQPVFETPGLNYPVLTTGQVIVKFKPGTPQAQVAAVAAQNGCRIGRQMAGLPQTYVFNPASAKEVQELAASVARDPQVVYSHPSLMFKLNKHQVAGPIEDPLYPFQWHLHNTGQLSSARPGADIKAPEAWNITMGAGAIIAVIDDCLQRDHPDLRDNYLTGFDFVGSEVGFNIVPDPDDPDGQLIFTFIDPAGGDGDPSPYFGPLFDEVGDAHGTSTSGLIAARANNIGVRGVAPYASLIGCKIGLGGTYTSDQDIADAFIFAEANGAMAINNSWGAPGGAILPVVPNSFLLPDLVSEAIDQVATNGRGGRGVLVLFSSGNAAIQVSYDNMYSTMPNVMSVGATLRDDTLTCYSSFGPEQSVVAPGGGFSLPRDLSWLSFLNPTCYDSDMTTTDVVQVPGYIPYDFEPFPGGDGLADPGFPCRGYNPPMKFLDVAFCATASDPFCIPLVPNLTVTDFPDPNYTHHFNGTSAACPVVSGVAALVFSINTNLTAEQVRNLIEHTADKPTYVNELFDEVTGHNDRYGHGRVNAFRAVQAAQAGQNWPSPVRDVQNISSQTLVQLLWLNPETDLAGILVARSTGQLDWAPVDGIEYRVGQQVAPGVTIVANDLLSNLDQTGLQTGVYQYALFARNANNFYSWGRRTSFGAEGTARPLASIAASPRVGAAPLTVHFAGGGIDKTGIVAFNWSFGDGTIGSGPTVDHIYTTGGTYMATLTVTNAVGQTAQTNVQIVVSGSTNALPNATITASPSNGVAPLVVLFQASGTDTDGIIVRYDWDFGDGTRSSGQTVEHTYIGAGTYGVTMTATDDRGGVSTSVKLITVASLGTTAAATEPQNLLSPAQCGTGAASATVMSLAGLGLMLVRRRR